MKVTFAGPLEWQEAGTGINKVEQNFLKKRKQIKEPKNHNKLSIEQKLHTGHYGQNICQRERAVGDETKKQKGARFWWPFGDLDLVQDTEYIIFILLKMKRVEFECIFR